MGVGGALLMTTVLAVAIQIFTPEEQPKAIGIWAAVNSLGFAAGPLLGGFMLNHFWWGAIFLINIPVAVLALVAVVVLVPESKNPQETAPTWWAPCSPRSAWPPWCSRSSPGPNTAGRRAASW